MSVTPDHPSASDLAGRLARLQALVLGEPERAKVEVREVLEQARALRASPQEALALLELSRCAFLQGDYTEMLSLSEEALTVSRHAHLSLLESRALNSIGLAHQRFGALDQAMQYFLDSLRLSQQVLDKEGTARVLSNIGLVYVSLEEYQQALEIHEQALEMAQASGHAVYTANLLASLMEDHYHLKQHPQVLELADEAIMFAHSNGLSRFECSTRATLTKTLLALGRVQAAQRVCRAGLRVARWARDQEMIMSLSHLEGRALLALGKLPQAQERLQESLNISVQTSIPSDELEIRATLKEPYLREGKEAQAAEQQREWERLQQEVFGQESMQRTRRAVTQFHQQMNYRSATVGLHPWSAELTELTRSLKRANMELAHRSAHDPMTGAINRLHFQVRMQKQLDFLGPNDLLGVVVVGLDHMKTLNSVFGQSVGDALLAAVVRRLRDTLRAGDLVGRLGGDEFILMLTDLGTDRDLELVMRKVLLALRAPFQVQDHVIHITASQGGVIAPRDGQTLEDLLGNADLAFQQAKVSGRNTSQVFQPHLSAPEQERRMLKYDLKFALERQEFQLHFQPQYRLPGSELVGVEALIRWHHPLLGWLSPTLFIPLAEESHLIHEVGDWVINEACRQAVEWNFTGRGLKMSVNVSPLQFSQPNFTLGVRHALEQSGLAPQALMLELTESAIHHDQVLARTHLNTMNELGVGMALDDFGTGFSSLSMLQSLPFHTMKLDRSFLNDLLSGGAGASRARTLVRATVELAHQLGMQVTAEGVETPEHLHELASLACDSVQGFLLARPAPASELNDVIQATPTTGSARSDTSN